MRFLKCFVLILSLILTLSACTSMRNSKTSKILTKDVDEKSKEELIKKVDTATRSGDSEEAISDLGLKIVKENFDENNILISPLSIHTALAMTANGASGNTLKQMEATLGMDVSSMNKYFYDYIQSINEKSDTKFSLADSIWIKNDENMTINKDFVGACASYYDSEVFGADFDNSTLIDINKWVASKTGDMIPKILDEIDDDAAIYLINALAFESEWEENFEPEDSFDGSFTTEDGDNLDARYMKGVEDVYLENEDCTGVVKFYKDSRYGFVGLLPNDGVSMKDFISSLDGDSLKVIMDNRQEVNVKTIMPSFKADYDIELKDTLISLGMLDAFEFSKAEFTMAHFNVEGVKLLINRVLHKTFIEVGEEGTKAAAATVVEMKYEGVMMEAEVKEVYLKRPFVYMIWDFEKNVPLFIGVMMEP